MAWVNIASGLQIGSGWKTRAAHERTAWPAFSALLDPDYDVAFTNWVDGQPCQLMLLAPPIHWTAKVEELLVVGATTETVARNYFDTLELLAKKVLEDIFQNLLTKVAQLITEMLVLLRRYWDTKTARTDMNRTCCVATTSASLYNYSMAENLCETPLTGRYFLTMTQTLHTKMGGNPFGPGLSSNLPDNLEQLFREMAMITPNKSLIAEVQLFSRGFATAERLGGKIVSLFDLCLPS
eukprot:g20698.t1